MSHPTPTTPIAPTPQPPYCAVIFTSVRAPDDADGYAAMSDRMTTLAAQQPGYLGIESARSADGLGITVSYWIDEHAARAWKKVAEHIEAQRIGRERWYEAYRVRIAKVEREYGSRSPDAPR